MCGGEGARVHALVSHCEMQSRWQEYEKALQQTKTKCVHPYVHVCVCVHMCSNTPCPLPLFLPCASLFFTPSLRSLPLSSLARAPSPTTTITPRPLSLSASLLTEDS